MIRTKLPSEKSLSSLKKDLDKVFNEFIRKRDSVQFNKAFHCISCGEWKTIDQMNAGHYHAAGNNESVRWDERNVNGQCIQCNLHLHGNLLGYQKGMIKKYGQKVLDELEIKRFNLSKMHKFEVTLLIQQYKEKLKKV